MCTPRQSLAFVQDACGAAGAQRIEASAEMDAAARERVVAGIIAWAEAHPSGAVVSTSDIPSVLHALAGARRPDLRALRAASLDAILATLDKAWTRRHVLAGLDGLPHALLTRDTDVVPSLGGSGEVLLKPLDGCASVGITRSREGSKVDAGALRAPRGWLAALRRERLGADAEIDAAVALVEAYVPDHVARVSVDGWVDDAGHAVPFAISDNVYAADAPDRFDHQLLPTRLSPGAQSACWTLWREVARRLARDHALTSQPFDVEMFVWDDADASRVEVMEVNARLHPNITPVLQRCVPDSDPLAAHFDPPDHEVAPEATSAGAMLYVWSADGAPDWSRLEASSHRDHLLASPFEGPGPRHGDLTCWGWLYAFAPDGDLALERGRAALARLVETG